jgi:hypothetical protein
VCGARCRPFPATTAGHTILFGRLQGSATKGRLLLFVVLPESMQSARPRVLDRAVFGFACDGSAPSWYRGRVPGLFLGSSQTRPTSRESQVWTLLLLYPRSTGALKESVFVDEWLAESGHGIPDHGLQVQADGDHVGISGLAAEDTWWSGYRPRERHTGAFVEGPRGRAQGWLRRKHRGSTP